ncbi:MAG TPA: 4-hydroxy-3-methylbut-2-enyl diphosphate reductase [Puia sp.]|jgi:4-hydroxy-3-methylbut-2-enyl diphosphate reductase
MKNFDIPIIYRSPLISAIKNRRRQQDKMKKDFTPTLLDFSGHPGANPNRGLHIYLARHFGFCYGVENAIEISFRTILENPGKRIFLLSEMIHNPQVNADLLSRGIRFLQDTHGGQIIPFETLNSDDIVIIPAFGTTLEIEERLRAIGIQTENYNTTCPFVEKVWNRSTQIAQKNYTIVVHGKPGHEETRATFSHAAAATPTVVVKDMKEAKILAEYIKGTLPPDSFYTAFKGQYSEGFDVKKDLTRIGVVNQTTMLASDTQAIADYLKQTMIEKHGLSETPANTSTTTANNPGAVNSSIAATNTPGNQTPTINDYFADTRDTLCYATLDNQSAVLGLLDTPADLAIVVGGYNSSNTSHLVELCEEKMPTYFISSEEKILSQQEILHYNFHEKREGTTKDWLSSQKTPQSAATTSASAATTPLSVLITSGASCPDALVEAVIRKIAGYYATPDQIEKMVAEF